MEQQIFQFTEWVYQNYGRRRCAVCLFIMLAFLALVFILLNALPAPKTVAVWSACSSCKYKRKKSNVFVLACPERERPRFLYINSPPCPRQHLYEGCRVIESQSDPAFFKREELPEGITE